MNEYQIHEGVRIKWFRRPEPEEKKSFFLTSSYIVFGHLRSGMRSERGHKEENTDRIEDDEPVARSVSLDSDPSKAGAFPAEVSPQQSFLVDSGSIITPGPSMPLWMFRSKIFMTTRR